MYELLAYALWKATQGVSDAKRTLMICPFMHTSNAGNIFLRLSLVEMIAWLILERHYRDVAQCKLIT